MPEHVGDSSSPGLRSADGRARRTNAVAQAPGDPYRTLFHQLPQPVMTLRLDDPSAHVQDATVLDANTAARTFAGGLNIVGRSLREALPELAATRLDAFEQVVRSGIPLRNDPLAFGGRRHVLQAYPVVDDERVLVVVLDTDPADAQPIAKSRDAFKVRLQDAIRVLDDPVEIQTRACELLGEFLRASRVCYADAEDDGDTLMIRRDYVDGVPSIAGRVRLDDFGTLIRQQLRAGTTVALQDGTTDPRISDAQRAAFAQIFVRGAIGVPLVKDGRLVAVLSVHQSSARPWTAEEIALVEDVAERTWDAVQRACAEAKLRIAEERYLALFNAIDQGFCTIELAFDAQGAAYDYRFLEVSPSFERQTGIKNAVGRWMREIARDHDAQWYAAYGRVALTGEAVRFESCSTPLKRWWAVYAFRVDAPELHRVAVLFNDITPRKQAEQALRNRAQQVQTLIEQAPIGVYLVDADFVLRHLNPIALRTIGNAAGGIEGRDFREIVGELWQPEHRDGIVRMFTRVMTTGEPLVMSEWAEHRIDREDVRHYALRIVRITQSDGRFGVVCYFRDVSDDVQAQRRLAASRAEIDRQRRLYEAILDNTPDLAYVFDREHRFAYANRTLLQMWVRTAEEAIGRTCLELGYEPWHAQMHDREIEQVVASAQPIRGEVPFTGTFGRRIYDYIFVPVLNASGDVEAIAGTTRDVTDYRATEQALDTARRAAETASRAKDKFLAMLSHELRTPLTPVLMTLGMLDRRGDLPPDLAREVGLMRRNVEIEVRLIDDLLDVSRMITDKLQLQRARLDWNQAVRDACDTCRALFEEKQLRLRCDYARGCGDVHADPVRLQQVLWNILRNAAKFTPEGQDVYVHTWRDETSVGVRVRDTGIGIRPDVLPTIFEAFEQGEEAITRHLGGMGLGLAISKSLIDLHGGTLTATSDGPGSGATFAITLPSLEKQPAPGGAPGAADAHPACSALRILTVEDHPDTSAALVRFLELRGHRVVTVNTIGAALDTLARDRFDLLISDIGLPDGTGHDLMREVAERYRIRGIAVSGYGMAEDVQRCIDAGFSAHVLKPVDIELLERTIADVVCRERDAPT